MADFYLDKGHFITARRRGYTFFDEDDACAGLWNSVAACLNCYADTDLVFTVHHDRVCGVEEPF